MKKAVIFVVLLCLCITLWAATIRNPRVETDLREYIESLKELQVGDHVRFGKNSDGFALDWIVLDIQGNDALIISSEVLFDAPYNSVERHSIDVTWETSTLRSYLNDFSSDGFIGSYFTEEERAEIRETHVINEDNYIEGTDGGNDTVDRVFILSLNEAMTYPLYELGELYDSWWLRTPGNEESDVLYIDNVKIYDADAYTNGIYTPPIGVRPVMWVSLKRNDLIKKRYYFETVSFGRNSDGSPMDWYILDIDGDEALLLSKYVLTEKVSTVESSGIWEKSDNRAFLNDSTSGFISRYFSSEEIDDIIEKTISTPDNPEYGTDGGEDTRDRVFLLSIDEVQKYLLTQREIKATARAKNSGSCSWALRSPGEYKSEVSYITTKYSSTYGIYSVSGENNTLRPALWVNIASGTSVKKYIEKTITFGTNPDGEPVEWIVLEEDDEKSFLLSKDGLFEMQLADNYGDESKLYGYLNDNSPSGFLGKWFSAEERDRILETSSKDWDGEKRKVFLPSGKYIGGYSSDIYYNEYADFYLTIAEFKGRRVSWWLANSPWTNISSGEHYYVSADGSYGAVMDFKESYFYVRPCLWLSKEEITDEKENEQRENSDVNIFESAQFPIEYEIADDQYDAIRSTFKDYIKSSEETKVLTKEEGYAALVYLESLNDTELAQEVIGNSITFESENKLLLNGYIYPYEIKNAKLLIDGIEYGSFSGNSLHIVYEKEGISFEFDCITEMTALSTDDTITAGDKITFGHDETNEEMKWIVLEIKDDRMLLLFCGTLIGSYNNSWSPVTWETCDMRKYLNDESTNGFIGNCFTDEEKSRILETAVSTDDAPYYKTEGGEDTIDKVFLLSIEEIKKYSNILSIGDNTLLRTPGYNNEYVSYAIDFGSFSIYEGGISVIRDYYYSPVMWVQID